VKILEIDLISVFKYYQQFNELSEKKIISLPALKGIDLQIPFNSTILIMGPSGSGKTTLLDVISSNIPPTSGNIIIDKIDIEKLNKIELETFRWQFIGYLKQNLEENFIENLSFFQIIELFKHNPLFNSNLVIDGPQLKIYMNLLGLTDNHLLLKYKFLSSGEKQRIGLLFLLFRNPKIFLLDEPTSYLDEQNKNKIIDLLLELKKVNKTIIITSHDQIFYKITDDIYFLKDGLLASENVLMSFPDLITGNITFPIGKVKDNILIRIPLLIKKIFNSERVLKYILNDKNEQISIIFFLVSKEEFIKLNTSQLYFVDKENDYLDINDFIRYNHNENYFDESKSNWLLDKNQFSLNLTYRNN
jgi:putative ABC transport system ATP-binding protein